MEGFDKDPFVHIYSNDWKHRQTDTHTSWYIETSHTMHGALENVRIMDIMFDISRWGKSRDSGKNQDQILIGKG